MSKKIYSKWDLHHHIVPDFYVEEMKKMDVSVAGIKWPKWDVKSSLKMMDQFHVEKAFVSLSTPGVFFGDLEYSIDLNRKCNRYIANMVEKYPNRFGGFATVTLPDVQSAIGEAIYALDELGLDGIALKSNVQGHYLGDASFVPFYEVLNTREAVVYVHPNEVPKKENHLFLNPLYLWQNDTTAGIIDFINSGYHKQFPRIKWIFSHGGGILAPLYSSIIETIEKNNSMIKEELEVWKNQVYLDTASKAYDNQLPYLLEFSDWRHIVFGSDIGWGNSTAVKEVEKAYETLDIKAGYSQDMIEDIFINNAKRLFKKDVVEVISNKKFSYSLPGFGLNQKDINYHCHNVESALNSIESGLYTKVYLSIDQEDVWLMDDNDRQVYLHNYNLQLAELKRKYPDIIYGLCAIDPDMPEWSISEIERGIGDLNLDGVSLSISCFDSEFTNLIDENLMKMIGTMDKPVMLHPKFSHGVPLISKNKLDVVYFIAKTFYMDQFKKYLLNKKIILTHTGGSIQYLSQPFNFLYYMAPKLSMQSMMAMIWETFIIKKPKGYLLLKNMIIS